MNKKHYILSIILLIFCFGASFNPIGCNTTITGTVTDSATGNPISGAIVTIEGIAPVTTGTDGIYTFTDVPYDYYKITVSSSGYLDNGQAIDPSYFNQGIA